MSSPLVSVLVPLYNHARYLEVCLDSIAQDPWPEKEIVVLDDGSTDESFAIAQAWQERLPHNIRCQLKSRPNRGVSRTVNELLEMASGEYLVLLASDDYLLPGGIAARVDYLQRHPGKLAVFGDCIVVDGNGETTHESGISHLYKGNLDCLADPEMFDLELIYNWSVPGPGFMAHRDLYATVGKYDEDLIVEDWDMYLRIAARGMLGFIPGPVAAYRYHPANTVLNPERSIAMAESLMKSAWKNAWSFSGLKRMGLFHHYFRLKNEVATARNSTIGRFISRKALKMLKRWSVLPYEQLMLSRR